MYVRWAPAACPDLEGVYLLTHLSTATMQQCLEQCLYRNGLPTCTTGFFDTLAPTEGAHVCTSDSSDHQGYCPHAGSAGFAGTRFAGKPKDYGELCGKEEPAGVMVKRPVLALGLWDR
jgi:hypothetical protein